jgi:hypothetical protein
MGFNPSHAQENILANGGFEDGIAAPWGTYGGVTTEVVGKLENAVVREDPIEGNFCLHITVPAAGANFWDSGLQHAGHVFEKGKKYTLSAFLKSKEGTLDINFKPELAQDPWDGYGEQSFTMTEEWTEFSITTPVFAEDVSPAEITFHIAYAPGDFWIDCVRFYEGDYVPPELGDKSLAAKPVPADGAIHPDTWINLSWKPGDFAVSHDVYFGENFDDVNAGAESTFQGNQAQTYFVAGFPGFPYPDGFIPGTTYYWRIDEVNDLDPNSPWKGPVWSFTVPPKIAYNPNPPDGAKFENQDVKLSWTAGFGAKLHHVYFGDSFDDVNSAVMGLPQAPTTYNPGPLELDKFYFWRIDEFDGVATHKGDVWSFRTLPVIPISNPNLIGWWKLDEGPGSTAFDWSGHGNNGTLQGDPQWVAGQIGDALKLDGRGDYVELPTGFVGSDKGSVCAWIKTTQSTIGMIFYGSDGTSGNGYGDQNELHLNMESSGLVEFYIEGPTDVSAETSALNDDAWHHIAATWQTNGQVNLYVDGGLAASVNHTGNNFQFSGRVRLGRPNDNERYYNGLLDDVRVYNYVLSPAEITETMRGDPLLAWGPKPGNGSAPYIKDATPLSWSPGDNAAQHDVYLGTDRDAVVNADESDTTGIYRGRQGATSYNPPDVEWGGGPYYWRVDEYNNDATISKGNVWSFTVINFITIDDFESYDIGNNEIWWVWKDGLGYAAHGNEPAYPGNGTGSMVGDETTGSYMEETIVHGGRQSMPFFYDNSVLKYSEVEKTLSSRRDWTEEGVGVLSLWFYGDASNAAEPMYVALNGSAVVPHDNPNAAQIETWTRWTIDLQAFADQGVNLANVNTLAIGFGNKKNPVAGGSGTMYFDDIRLYRPAQ